MKIARYIAIAAVGLGVISPGACHDLELVDNGRQRLRVVHIDL